MLEGALRGQCGEPEAQRVVRSVAVAAVAGVIVAVSQCDVVPAPCVEHDGGAFGELDGVALPGRWRVVLWLDLDAEGVRSALDAAVRHIEGEARVEVLAAIVNELHLAIDDVLLGERAQQGERCIVQRDGTVRWQAEQTIGELIGRHTGADGGKLAGSKRVELAFGDVGDAECT